MKITDTTVKPPEPVRTFTLELTALELQSIELAIGMTSAFGREERAKAKGVKILDHVSFSNMYISIGSQLENYSPIEAQRRTK